MLCISCVDKHATVFCKTLFLLPFKDCLHVLSNYIGIAYYFSTTVLSAVLKQSLKVSSSLKQIIFVLQNMHACTHKPTNMHTNHSTPAAHARTHARMHGVTGGW